MRNLSLILLSVLALAPAAAAVDSLSFGPFGESAGAIRAQMVEGIAAAVSAETAQSRSDAKN